MGLRIKVAQVTGKHCVRSRASICGRFDKRVDQDFRDKDEVVNSIPSIDGWANGTYESGVGAVFEVFCRTQAERLARVASISGVHSE